MFVIYYCAAASDALACLAPSLTLNFRETSVKHCNSKVFLLLVVEWIQGQDSFDSTPTYGDFDTLGILQTNEEEIRNKKFKFNITWRTTTMPMVSLPGFTPTTRRLSSGSLTQWLAITIQARGKARKLFAERPENYIPENKRYSVLQKEAPASTKLLKGIHRDIPWRHCYTHSDFI